jgi:hypothetical protein
MSSLPESTKDTLEKVSEKLAQELGEKVVPILSIKLPDIVAEIPEVIKDENVKKCFPSFNFVELFRSLMSGLTKQKKIVTSE